MDWRIWIDESVMCFAWMEMMNEVMNDRDKKELIARDLVIYGQY